MCERCACPALPITVRSPPAARSRTQRDQGNLQSVPPPSGRRPRSRTAAGTETEHNDDHDDCSARLPGAAPASEGTDRPRTGLSGCRVGAGRCPAHFHLHLRFTVRCPSSFPSSSLQLERRTARRISLRQTTSVHSPLAHAAHSASVSAQSAIAGAICTRFVQAARYCSLFTAFV